MYLKINTNEKNIFFCSDPHYHHKPLIKGLSTWENKERCRDFKSLTEHDTTLVNNINSIVKKEDVLFCLGDWSFGEYKNSTKLAKEFRNRLNVKEIHLILGNHDNYIRKNKDNIQNIFTSVSERAELEVVTPINHGKGKTIRTTVILSHYAMRTWNKAHKGSYMLYGHSHGSLDEMTPLIANPTWIGDGYFIKNYRTMDVGFDTHPKFRPYSWHEIKAIMEERGVELEVDHHLKKLTNIK